MPAAPPPRVLVVGSANVDFTVAAARLPRPGETVTGGAVRDVESAAAAGRALLERGAEAAIVTLGQAGALACTARGEVRVPAFEVGVVDTTGAGDAFNAGLAVALAERRALPEALRLAAATAALACTRRGAWPSLPTRAEVEALLVR